MKRLFRDTEFLKVAALWFFAMVILFAIDHAKASNLQPANNYFTGYNGQMNNAVTTTIASSGTTSAAVTLKGFSLVGILLPATFTGTTLTFTVSVDCTNYFALKTSTSGTSLSYTVAQGTYAAINPVDFYGVNCLKIVSGSTEGSARTLTLAVKGI
jgi:hypothetical protein